MFHDCSIGKLVITLDVRADVRSELAASLMLKTFNVKNPLSTLRNNPET